MASDLATALISGNNAGLLTADPSLMAITPQLQLAQTLSQQGLSTAPAYPMQAAARLAQAIAGVKVAHDAQSDLANLSSGAAGEMGKIFPEGTPLGDGLRSQSPMVRMLAMQQAGKAMLLNSETKGMSPGQVQVAPGTPRAGGAVVAANPYPISRPGQENFDLQNNPAMAPNLASAAGQRAQAEALGRAPTTGKRIVEGPRGPEEIDAAARFDQTPVPPVISARPIATVPIRAPLATSTTAAPGPAPKPAAPLPSGAKGQERAPALPATAPGQPAPGSFEDRFSASGMRGTPVKDIPYETRLEAEKLGVKELQEKSTPSYEAAQNLKGRLTVMDHNIDALGPKWMGAGANAKGEFGKAWNSLLDSAGVQGYHIDPSKIATWEEFNKESTRAGMELIKSNFGGSREAASIIQMGASAVPSAQQTFLGAKYNLSSIRAATQREIDLHEYKSNLLSQGKSLVGADAAFNKQHPAEEYAMAGIVNAIPHPAIEHLRANPDLASHFDKQFGAGTAEFILGTK